MVAKPETLIERRHRQTRDEIARAAIELFATNGYDDTTMDDVASAAGVSRRTAYRHFAHKHDLIFNETYIWLDHYAEAVATAPEGEPIREVINRGLISVAELIESRRENLLTAWAVINTTPSLQGALGAARRLWHDRHLNLVLSTSTDDDPISMLDAAIMAGTLVATADALVAVWANTQPDADMVEMTRLAIDRIDPLWPPPTR